jgi:uncharacterized protein (DUF302 family)
MKIKYIFSWILLLLVATNTVADASKPKTEFFDIKQTVYMVKVNDDVNPMDLQMSILSKAAELNLKFVSHQPLSAEINARGKVSRQIDIYQFCNPLEAREMLDHNLIFVAYMPCRIAVVEDESGDFWIMMLDFDMLIDNAALDKKTKILADEISLKLKKIVEAGKYGSF